MSEFQQLSTELTQFTGRVRLFPLPGFVMFPHVVQPLHAFEPRYRKLIDDALKGDRLVAMATLAPGWEADYEGRPALYPTACLSRIISHHRLADGTINLLVAGVQRIHIASELPPWRSYREARVELRADSYTAAAPQHLAALRSELRERFRTLLPQLADAREQVDHLLGADLPLGVLCDLVGYMIDVDLSEKMALLDERDVDRRARHLLKLLKRAAKEDGPSNFPPPFSMN